MLLSRNTKAVTIVIKAVTRLASKTDLAAKTNRTNIANRHTYKISLPVALAKNALTPLPVLVFISLTCLLSPIGQIILVWYLV